MITGATHQNEHVKRQESISRIGVQDWWLRFVEHLKSLRFTCFLLELMKLALLESLRGELAVSVGYFPWSMDPLAPMVTGVTKVQVNEVNPIKSKGLDK